MRELCLQRGPWQCLGCPPFPVLPHLLTLTPIILLRTVTGSQGRAGHPLPWVPELSRSQEAGCVQVLGTKGASVVHNLEASSKGWERGLEGENTVMLFDRVSQQKAPPLHECVSHSPRLAGAFV